MTTKETERKALELIRSTVEKLGPNSYVGTALEGCFELAEENIENDFALSMKDRWEAASEARDACQHRIVEMATEISTLKTQLQLGGDETNELRKKLEDEHEDVKWWSEKAQSYSTEIKSLRDKLANAEAKAREKDEEIIRLKAKLYDLMMK